MSYITVSMINRRAKSEPEVFVKDCEERYADAIRKTAEKICENKGRTLVMVAGPSSSGKTTTAKLLQKEFEIFSRKSHIISLDDFYLDCDKAHTFEDGTVDYETVKALDVDYITECLHALMNDGRCMLPRFSFVSKTREYYAETVADKDDIVIVEGLHALNPLITEPLEDEPMLKIYVSVSSRIFENEKVLMTKRDIRFVRRLIRDYRHRGSEPEYTFYLWKGVRMGEDRYLFPFSDRADMKIDSIHPYELCVFKKEAVKLLDQIDVKSVYYKEAEQLKRKLSLFDTLSKEVIPSTSLLTEFIG